MKQNPFLRRSVTIFKQGRRKKFVPVILFWDDSVDQRWLNYHSKIIPKNLFKLFIFFICNFVFTCCRTFPCLSGVQFCSYNVSTDFSFATYSSYRQIDQFGKFIFLIFNKCFLICFLATKKCHKKIKQICFDLLGNISVIFKIKYLSENILLPLRENVLFLFRENICYLRAITVY